MAWVTVIYSTPIMVEGKTSGTRPPGQLTVVKLTPAGCAFQGNIYTPQFDSPRSAKSSAAPIRCVQCDVTKRTNWVRSAPLVSVLDRHGRSNRAVWRLTHRQAGLRRQRSLTRCAWSANPQAGHSQRAKDQLFLNQQLFKKTEPHLCLTVPKRMPSIVSNYQRKKNTMLAACPSCGLRLSKFQPRPAANETVHCPQCQRLVTFRTQFPLIKPAMLIVTFLGLFLIRLDEENQLLYFIAGSAICVALAVATWLSERLEPYKSD
jgi:hypothetical protein